MTPEFISAAASGGGTSGLEARPNATPPLEHRHGEPLAVLAWIGVLAERLGRRRADRKIKHEAKRQERALKQEQVNLNQKLEQKTKAEVEQQHQQIRRQEQLQREIRQAKEALVTHVTPSFEKPKAKTEKPTIQVKKPMMPPPETEPAPLPAERPPESINTLAERHYERTQPEVVLQKVTEAAEKNIALEGLYERQQEIKDAAGEPIAGALQSLNQAAQAQSQVAAGLQTQLREVGQPSVNQPPQNLYKTAAIGGVAAAALLILGFAVVLVVTR